MILRDTVLFLALTLLCGCSNQKVEVTKYSGFEQTKSVKSIKIEVPHVLLYPRNLFLLEDKLIVLNEKTDTLFQMFGVPDFKYQGQFGIKGEGPDDFHLPSIQAVNQTEFGFTLSDMNRLKNVNLEKAEPHITSTDLPYDFQYFNGLIELEDSLYCCNTEFGAEQELRFLYPDGKYEEFGIYPEKVKPRFKDALARNQAYNSLLVAKSDGTRVAVFYQHLRRYRIYKTKGELETDNVLDIFPCQEFPDVDDRNRYIHPIALYATDRYIYALNLDMKADEIGNKVRNPNIQLFDWEGHPLKQYQLDCYISSFTVDEQNGAIYGVFVEDENHIYKFEL